MDIEILWLANLSEVETVRMTNPAAVVQEYKNVLARRQAT